ncbi:MAG: hypothetical protein ABW185_16665, partial [Sedimenticola sp.]
MATEDSSWSDWGEEFTDEICDMVQGQAIPDSGDTTSQLICDDDIEPTVTNTTQDVGVTVTDTTPNSYEL